MRSQISHDFARILENNSIFGQNLQKMKKCTTQQNSSYEWAIFKFSELSLKIKSEKNFLQKSI